jgi:hypothetical protein
MSTWTDLPTDYTDAVWDGRRKYNQIYNSDGTVSFDDVTVYTNREKSFFGAKDANQMNAAMNEIVTITPTISVENATLTVDTGHPTYGKIILDNAGAHNAIYRGKSLGTSVTDAQWAAISAGTFEDLYIGDYWTINSKVYRIAAFDYYLNCGDTATTKHHVVLVPDASMYSAQMNTSNTTDGGYVGSAMYTANLATAKTTITTAFGSAHILSHRIYLNNAVSSGRPSGGAWVDSTVDLMCEQMVYGSNIHAPMSYGSSIANFKVEKSQLPLFALNHSLIEMRVTWWLRDVVTAAYFAYVVYSGNATYDYASNSNGVRPAFCIS